jgi:hypothetical protein
MVTKWLATFQLGRRFSVQNRVLRVILMIDSPTGEAKEFVPRYLPFSELEIAAHSLQAD